MGLGRSQASTERLPDIAANEGAVTRGGERWPVLLGRLAAAVVASLLILPLLAVVSRGAPWSPSLPDGVRGFFTRSYAAQEKSHTGSVQSSLDSSNKLEDKLLGGLLATGFDEASCLSRYQSALYHKASPHLPSSYLLQRLRQYEALHGKCGPSTELYNRSIDQLKSGHSNETVECNYVVWLYCSGLGNRILTLTSAFLYALLTNRVLLIEKNADMGDLFCEPFPKSSWLLPTDFPLSFTGFNAQYDGSYGNLLKQNVISHDFKGDSRKPLPAYMYLHLAHDYSDYDKRFFCDEDQIFLRRMPWLVLLSNNYFLPSFFEMPAYEEELSRLFPKKDTVFHHLGRYLFHPTNPVWGLITRYYGSYLAKADERLGIQIRVFKKSSVSLQHVGDQILGCALKEKLLPETTSRDISVVPITNSTRSKAVLITSLNSGYYDRIRDMYWEQPTANGETITVYQPSHEETQQIGNKMHEMKALAEMYLLSMTDVLVTTAVSTFGYVAQGLGGLRPYILFKSEDQGVPDPPCSLDFSLEPCFHAPPYYHCKERKVISSKPLPPYLRHCGDVRSGLKLVEKQE